MTKRERLEEYLMWLISPQDKGEQEKFRDVIDDHCAIANRIPCMTIGELTNEVNIQIKPYGLQIAQ